MTKIKQHTVRATNIRVDVEKESAWESNLHWTNDSENWRRHFYYLQQKVVVLLKKLMAIIRETIICFICRSLSIVHVIWSQQVNFELSSSLKVIQTEIPFSTLYFFDEWKLKRNRLFNFHLKKTTKSFIQRNELDLRNLK